MKPMANSDALQELISSNAVMIGPREAGTVLGVHQSCISEMGQKGTLPFPAFVSGNRVKISRIGFLKWGGWIEEKVQGD